MPPTSAVRTRAGAAALLLGLAVGQPPAAAASGNSSSDVAAQVRALDRAVNRVSDELGQRATAYEAAQARAARLTQQQTSVRNELERHEAAAVRSQASFDGLARAAYKGAVPPLVTALLSGEPRAVADLAYVRRTVERAGAERQATLEDDAVRRDLTGDELVRADVARREALAAQQRADAQLQALVARADALTAALAVAGDRLAQARGEERAAARAAQDRADAARRAALAAELGSRAGGGAPADVPPGGTWSRGTASGGTGSGGRGGCLPPSPHGEANGFLSEDGLCAIAAGRGHRLRTDAARAFDRLNDAHLADVGTPLCVTDSYRSYAAQVDVFRRKPALAATPGRSQHGWGLAVDLCGGVQRFGSAAHEWMRANAGRFGWVHPAWARAGGSKPEPWHWEYVGRPS